LAERHPALAQAVMAPMRENNFSRDRWPSFHVEEHGATLGAAISGGGL
jgi:hypothetical protein